ncbi:MAG TPA: ABC transporter ATP-binding protein, partial [Clostridiales bacterium]|nr:ABC transporter ATP-binding protein [Clostridiales bacterium]
MNKLNQNHSAMEKMPEKDPAQTKKDPQKNHSHLPKLKPGTIRRLLSYMGEYKLQIVFVMICILVSAGASVASSLFIQRLIDDYIVPMLGEPQPSFSRLFQAILIMGAVFLIGILATLFYNRTMVQVAQGTLKK